MIDLYLTACGRGKNQWIRGYFEKYFHYITSILLLLLIPVFWDSSTYGKYISLIAVILLGSLWLVFRTKHDYALLVPKYVILLLVFFCYQIILLVITPLPEYSIKSIIANFIIFGFLLFFVDSPSLGWKARTWENALISVAIFLSLLGLPVIIFFYLNWWQIDKFSLPPVGLRLPGILIGHPNHLAGYLNLVIPVALVRLTKSNHKSWKLTWSGIILLFLIIEFFTSSRGGWISLIIGLTVTTFLIFSHDISVRLFRFKSRDNFLKNLNKRQILVGGITFITFTVIVFLLIKQLNMTQHGGRWFVWEVAWNIFYSSPLWGRGPGSYSFLYPLFSRSGGGDDLYHAHNLWLQIASENGLVGFIIVIIFTILTIREVIYRWMRISSNSKIRANLASHIGAGVAILIHNVVDYLFQSTLYTLGVVLILALIIKRTTNEKFIKISNRNVIFLFASLSVISLIISLLYYSNIRIYTKGLSYAKNGDWVASRDNICLAADSKTRISLFDFQCSLANAMVSYELNDNESLKYAIEYQRKGLERDPYWFIHWANLASYEWELGDGTNAIDHMNEAINLIPKSASLKLYLGRMEEKLGQTDEALNNYKEALLLNPWLRYSVFFTQTELRKAALDTPINNTENFNMANRYFWEGWSAYGKNNITEAITKITLAIQADPKYPEAYAALGLMEQMIGHSDTAWHHVQTALFINEPSFMTLFISSKVAQHQGKYSTSIDYLFRAFYQNQNVYYYQINKFYHAAYREDYLPTDVSPYLIGAILDPDMQADFLRLAFYMRKVGKIDLSNKILHWIKEE